jgi:WD40 repeat protein/tRNA A-37 threonylcarbamoyl transferase component Bud32
MDHCECPPNEELAHFLTNDLPDLRWEQVAEHVQECDACQGRLDRLLSDDSITSWTRAVNVRTVPGPDPNFVAEMRSLIPRVATSPVDISAVANRSPGAAAAPADDTCPAHIGEYEILGILGRGGTAVAYKARQPRVGRIVALKRLRFRDQDATDIARFLREAEAAARVRHANVVQVYEVGEDEGLPYIAMELIDGGTLSDALTGSPVDPRTAAEFVERVTRAVAAAHECGVVHRDLKPANILLAPTGDEGRGRPTLAFCEPKVTDFGLARRIGDDRRLTLPDMLAGTPAYLAPEQVVRPSDVGPASDIYSLGAILFELLTGRPPLLGPTVLATLRLVEAAAPVSPRRLQPGLPRDLEAVCLKCLHKDPRHRYPSAASLAADLRRFLAGHPTTARPLSLAVRTVKFVRRYPLPAGLAIVLVLSLAVGLAGILWQWRAAVAARINLQGALASEADQRRDAEQNLYIARLAQASALWEGGEAGQARALLDSCRPAPGRRDLRGWEWNYLSRQFRAETRIIPLKHWVHALVSLPTPPGDSAELAVAFGWPRLNFAYKPGPGDGEAAFVRPLANAPALRPGPNLPGGAVGVAAAGSIVAWGTNTGEILLADRNTGQLSRTIADTRPLASLALTPDANVVVAACEDGRVRAFATATGEKIGEEVVDVGGPWTLVMNPAGTLIAVGGNRRRIRLLEMPAMRPAGELNELAAEVTALAFSPDGRHLAVGGLDGSVAIWDLGSRRETRRLRFDAAPIYAVTFRSDGKALAIGGADRAVRILDTTTDRALAVFRGHESSIRCLTFFADGGWLASGAQDGTVRVWDATCDPRGRRVPFSGRLNDVAFGRTDRGLLIRAASLGGEIRSWTVANGRTIATTAVPLRHRQAYPVRYMAFLNGGRLLGGFDKIEPAAVAEWDSETGDRVVRLGPRADYLTAAADASGRRFAWATKTPHGVDVHWRDDNGALSEPLHLNVPSVRALAVDPTGRRLAALTMAPKLGEDQTVWVLDAIGQTPPKKLVCDVAMYGGVAFSRDGRFLGVSARNNVMVFRLEDGQRLHEVDCTAATTCLAFSPDGGRLAAVGYNGVTTLYDPIAGKHIFELRGLSPGRPDDMAADARVAFSPDGQWLVSTNWDNSLNLWNGAPPTD